MSTGTVGPDPASPDLLATIVAGTQRITASRRAIEPLDALERRASATSPRGDLFESRLRRPDGFNVIAECKRRSPSRGVLAPEYDPVRIARACSDSSAGCPSAATMSSTASAPAARASNSWYSSTTKSLRSSGTSTAARTACRCARAPSKNVGSVSTEIAAAPPPA